MSTYFTQLMTQWRCMPPGARVLLYTEICELYGRFTVIALLALYLTHVLFLSDHQIFILYAGFVTLLYTLPLVGGYLSDQFLGARVAMVLGIVFMTLGNLLLAWPHLQVIYLGLALVVFGTAFFSPTIPAMLHRLYAGRPNDHDTGFMFYYLAKNIGALLAPLVGGLLVKYAHYSWVFVLSSLVMLSGLVAFVRHQQVFSEQMPLQRLHQRFEQLGRLKSLVLLAVAVLLAVPFIDMAMRAGVVAWVVGTAVVLVLVILGRFRQQRLMSWSVLCHVVLAWCAVALFQAFLGQGGTTLNLFIDRMVARSIHGFEVPTTFFYVLDPLFMLTVGPILFVVLTRALRQQIVLSAVAKFALGLLLLAAGFTVFTIAAVQAGSGPVGAGYVVLAYLIFPLAELSLMPVALSFVTQLAPQGKAATMVGLLTLASAVAGYGTGLISDLASIAPGAREQVAVMANRYVTVFSFSAACLGFGALAMVSYFLFLMFKKTN
jgi:POT family proton-dependent oligopeptide transporter